MMGKASSKTAAAPVAAIDSGLIAKLATAGQAELEALDAAAHRRWFKEFLSVSPCLRGERKAT